MDVVGRHLEGWTEHQIENFARVLKRAGDKLPPDVPPEAEVAGRVLRGILEDAPYAEDEVVAEYLGGVLASSKSGVSRDDRGASFVELIRRLSTYAIRAHFLLYASNRNLFGNNPIRELGLVENRLKLRMFTPVSEFETGLDLSVEEYPRRYRILEHSLVSLGRETLIHEDWRFLTDATSRYPSAPENDGIVFSPTILGIQLFFYAMGRPDEGLDNFLTLRLPDAGGVYVPRSSSLDEISKPDHEGGDSKPEDQPTK